MLKYGLDNFAVEVIDSTDSLSELNLKEIYWIKHYNSTHRDIGYNIASGGLSVVSSKSTRMKIGKQSKLRWDNDPQARKKMRLGLEKATKRWIEVSKKNRTIKTCKQCGIEFEVTNFDSNKKYCSRDCKILDTQSWLQYENGLYSAKKANIKRRENRQVIIKEIMLDWAENNTEYLLAIPYNKIKSGLQDVIDIINKEVGVKDLRTISNGVCGYPSSRKLLEYLKDYVKMYAVPDQN